MNTFFEWIICIFVEWLQYFPPHNWMNYWMNKNAGKWGENEEMEGEWGNGERGEMEIERWNGERGGKWKQRDISSLSNSSISLHFLSFSLISTQYTTFLASVEKIPEFQMNFFLMTAILNKTVWVGTGSVHSTLCSDLIYSLGWSSNLCFTKSVHSCWISD